MRVILPVCRLLFFHKYPKRYSSFPPPWALSRSGITPLALAGLLATTALSPMDVKAAGKGNHTNSTTATSLVTLTTMVSHISLGKGAQNHSSQTTPITRQPVRRHTNHPAPFSLTHTQTRRSARSGPRPTPVAPLPNKVKRRGQPNRLPTGRSKGSYPTRAVTINDTLSPSTVGGPAYNNKTFRRTRKSQTSSTRNGKWSERTNHYLSSSHWKDDWERSELISQTEEPLKSTISATVEPTPSTFIESKPTVPSCSEPTPSFLPEPTLSSSAEPTPSLLASTRVPEPDKPRPKPTCPPRAERPTLTFIRGDNQGNIYVKLENTPEFIEACQPLVYRLRSTWPKNYQLIATNLTANNTEFQVSTERSSDVLSFDLLNGDNLQIGHGTGDQQVHSRHIRDGALFNIYVNTMAFCQTNPSLSRRTGWLITQSFDPDTDQGRLVDQARDRTVWSIQLFAFEFWYHDQGAYQNQTCADKYNKMQLEQVGRFQPAGQCPITVTTGKIVYARIFASFWKGDCFSGPVGDGLQLNGQSAHGIVRRWGPFRGYIKFALNCQRLQSYDIWEHGALNFTLSRPTTRPGGEPDEAGITIPIQKRPDVTGVQLNHDNRRLTIHFRDEPSWCLAVVVTTAPFPALEPQVNGTSQDTVDNNTPSTANSTINGTVNGTTNGTANNTEPSSADWGQVFLCLNPDRVLSIPLGDSRPEQSDVVLISLIPVWDIEEDFSPENPRDRNLVQGAEHLVAYPGEQPPWDDNNPNQDSPEPNSRFTIKPCTGHCQTHLLPTMLANISNVTSGPCPWIPDPVTTQPTTPTEPTQPAAATLPGSVPVSITSPDPSSEHSPLPDRSIDHCPRPMHIKCDNLRRKIPSSCSGVTWEGHCTHNGLPCDVVVESAGESTVYESVWCGNCRAKYDDGGLAYMRTDLAPGWTYIPMSSDCPEVDPPWYTHGENMAAVLGCVAMGVVGVLAPCATSLCVGMSIGGCMMCKARQKTRPASDPPTHVESKEPTKQAKSSL